MELTEEEKKLAYSLLSDINTSSNKEREYELQGILKAMLFMRYPHKIYQISNLIFDFSLGRIEFK